MRLCLDHVVRTALLIAPAAVLLAAGASAASVAEPGAGTATPAPAAETKPRVVSVVRSDPRTGRLVQVIIAPKQAKRDPAVSATIDETARNLQVSPELVHSVIEVESNYNPYAVSPKGAQGLMQLMPATARRFGVTNSFDARQNIEGGVRYLKFLQETFQDDRLAIAAYNAGEHAVARYGGVPPYPETVNYVAKVGEKYSQAKKEKSKTAAKTKDAAKPAEPETVDTVAKPAEDEQRHVTAFLDA